MPCIKCKKELPEGAPFCPWCGKKQTSAPKRHRRRANGTGTIYKKSGTRDKPWIVEMNHTYVSSHASFAEAQKALEALQDADITPKLNWTFRQVYEAWKPEHFREIGATAKGNFTTAYKKCAPLYDRKFRSLRKSDFMSIVIAQEEAGYSESSVEKIIQLFGQLSQWAISESIATVNHARFVSTVATQKAERTPYTKAELELLAESDLPAAAILRILIATGCRPKDLFTAKLSDCHTDYFISGSKSEAGIDRAIGISDYGLNDYQALYLLATAKGCEYLIDAYKGNHVYANWRKREYDPLLKDSLGGKTPYAARHTFSTAAAKAKMPKDYLRRQMGHADIRTTDKVYTHLDDASIVQATQSVHILPKSK